MKRVLTSACLAAMMFSTATLWPDSGQANPYSADDPCSTAGAFHQKTDGDGVHLLVCTGTAWKDVASYLADTQLLSVAGTLKIADGGEECGTDYYGSLRYNSDVIQYCDTNDNWVSFATTSGSAVQLADETNGDTNIKVQADNGDDTDEIVFTTAGSEAMRIDENGNVGIGTDEPLYNLHIADSTPSIYLESTVWNDWQLSSQAGGSAFNIYSSTQTDPVLSVNKSARYEMGYGVLNIHASVSKELQWNGQTVLSLSGGGGNQFLTLRNPRSDNTSTIVFETNTQEQMRITGDGNVGIGTDDPAYPFHVASDFQNSVFTRSGKGIDLKIDASGNTSFSFYNNPGVKFTIPGLTADFATQANYTVGVGTQEPDVRLHAEKDSAAADSVTNVLRITSTNDGTGTIANGIGVGMEFEVETATGNNEIGGTIETAFSNVTDGEERSSMRFDIMKDGALTPALTIGTAGDGTTVIIRETTNNSNVARLVINGDDGDFQNGDYASFTHYGSTGDLRIQTGANGGSGKADIAILPANNVGVGIQDPKTMLDVNGSIKVGDGEEECGTDYYGAIRYNSDVIQYCDTNDNWVSFATTSGSAVELADETNGDTNIKVQADNGDDTDEIRLTAAGTEVMKIGQDGLIGPLMFDENSGVTDLITNKSSAQIYVANSGSTFPSSSGDLIIQPRTQHARSVRFMTASGTGTQAAQRASIHSGGIDLNGYLHFRAGRSSYMNNGEPSIYKTAGGGGSYPFNDSQILVLEGRAGDPKDIVFVTNGAPSLVVSEERRIGIGVNEPVTRLHVEQDSAAADAVSNVFRITSTNDGTGTIANGIGVGMEFEVETETDNNEIGAIIEAVATDVSNTTDNEEDFDLVFKTMNAGAAADEKMRLTSAGQLRVSPGENLDGHLLSEFFINYASDGDAEISSYTGDTLFVRDHLLLSSATGNMLGADNALANDLKIVHNRVDQDIAFETAPAVTGTLVEAMRITSAGNVGIGTTDPSGKLEVYDGEILLDDGVSNQTTVLEEGALKFSRDSDGGYGGKIYVESSDNDRQKLILKNREGVKIFYNSIPAIDVENGGSGMEVGINPNGADMDFRVRSFVDTHSLFVGGSNGRVGIGTDDPTSELSFGIDATISRGTLDASDTGSLMLSGGGVAQWNRGANIKLYGNEKTDNMGDIIIEAGKGNGAANIGDIYLATQYDASSSISRLFVRNDGHIGIGTTDPAAFLDVINDGTNEALLQLTRQGVGFVQFQIGGPDSPLNIQTDRWILFKTSTNTEVMALKGTGVGIGTDDPSEKLHVSGNALIVPTEANASGLEVQTSTGNTVLRTGGTNNPRVAINSSDDPRATLDVNGYMKLATNASEPATCDADRAGSIALTSTYTMCICDGSTWEVANTSTACTW